MEYETKAELIQYIKDILPDDGKFRISIMPKTLLHQEHNILVEWEWEGMKK